MSNGSSGVNAVAIVAIVILVLVLGLLIFQGFSMFQQAQQDGIQIEIQPPEQEGGQSRALPQLPSELRAGVVISTHHSWEV